jgi:predicted DCC family thiol-disulfide oxidoreductase YuxK
VGYAQAATGDQVDYQPYQAVADQYPDIAEDEFRAAIQLVHSDGQVTHGAQAAFETLALGGHMRLWERCYRRLPGFAGIAEAGYRFVAAHRGGALRCSQLLFGKELRPQGYALTIWVYLRLLALVYLAAFTSLTVQLPGLIGSEGILPVADYFGAVDAQYGPEKYWWLPSLLWLDSSDTALLVLGSAGIAFSLALLFNRLPRTSLICLYVAHLSLISGGQVFVTFQWDILLLECGFLAIFLQSRPLLFVWLHRLLLFRFILQSGLVKLMSGDDSWRNLTALNFHFESQPLPTFLAWYAHKLPELALQAGVFLTLVVELIVPFLLLMPRQARLLAAEAIVIFQLIIMLTGSYNYFNLLTVALCLLLMDDGICRSLVPGFLRERRQHLSGTGGHWGLAVLPVGVASLYLFLTVVLLAGTGRRMEVPDPVHKVLAWTSPLHIANTYGLFAMMTKSRPEIVIEGSIDGRHWLAYELPYKPGTLERAPIWATPHQPRLDWQLWFAALQPVESNPWFKHLVVRLLNGSEPVLALFSHNPFQDEPPNYVRARLYQYHFSDWETRRNTGAWWTRRYQRDFYPAAGLGSRSEIYPDW